MTRVVRWVPATKEVTLASQHAALGNISLYDALSATLNAKVEPAVEAMREAGKSVCFTWRKADAHVIAELAEAEGLEVELITGDQSHAERQLRVDRAREMGRSIVATIDSTGAGVDGLQFVATTGIFHALDYVPIKLAQAEARLHRHGVASPVTWVYIAMEGSADQHVINTVVDKLDQWRQAMGKDSTGALGATLDVQRSEEAALAEVMEAMKGDI
jgi:superfamily II DNA or RNA helicase